MKKLLKTMACMLAAIFAVTPVAAEETENWVVINLETPGNLGVEILYQADKLSDVTHLRVSGEINSTDWNTIKNLSNIQAIDLENTVTTAMPDETFNNRTSLVNVKLPGTLKEIGRYAFSGTSIKEINLSSPLKSLGSNVFYNCDSLQSVTFSADAEISEIPASAFSCCEKLSSINLPESVISIGNSAFYENQNLTQIELPSNLTSIGEYAFYNSGLINVTIPKYVNNIGRYAFHYSRQLQEVELPTSLHSLNYYTFYACDKLKKVICKSPTPPAVNSDAFPYDRSQITLVVPDFAVPDYKLDTYWLDFGYIEGGAMSDYWDIAGNVSFNNGHHPGGVPSITLQTGGSLNIQGNTSMPVDIFKMYYYQDGYYSSRFKFSQLINSSPLMSANKADVTYELYTNRWHFIALPFDVKVDDIYHSDTAAEFVVRYYDGATRAASNATGNSWKDVPAGSVIKAGTGIIVQANKEGSITFTCADDGKTTIFNPNSVTMELAANTAESNAHSGWNFVANPYPCYYDMYYAMLSCPITVYNPGYNNYLAYSLIDDDVVLWPGQPFFIQASDDVKEIVFSNVGRQFTAEASRPSDVRAKSPSAEARALFNISLSCGGLSDAARVVINPEAKEDYECSRDASKFLSDNTAVPQIYTLSPAGDYLAINERDAADGRVRLGYYAPAAGDMSITLSRIDGEAAIYDAATQKTIDLTEGEAYTFTASEAGFDDDRFTLILKAIVTTGIESVAKDTAAIVTTKGNTVTIANAAGREVMICSTDGKIYVNETAKADRMEYQLPCGLYIVKAGAYSSKCLIK